MEKKTLSESKIQSIFIYYFRHFYPDVLIFAIPNGAFFANQIQASKLKREGMVSGIPDLFVPEWKLWIEFKKNKKLKLSKNQEIVMHYLEKHNYEVVVFFGLLESLLALPFFCVGREGLKTHRQKDFNTNF